MYKMQEKLPPFAHCVGMICLIAASATACLADSGEQRWRAGEHAAALESWQQAALGGDMQAALRLAAVYRRGPIELRDAEQAGIWFRRAGLQGDPSAQYELGLMYELGVGVPQDPGEAARWYGMATAQGVCPSAMPDDFGLLLSSP